MQLSNLSLAYLVLELKPLLEGSIIRKVQQLKPAGFKLKLQTRQGTKDLILMEDAFFVSNHSFPVNDKPYNFALKLKKHILNKKILSLTQAGFERIVFIELEGFFIVLEMFHNGNILLLDKDKTIVDVLKQQEFAGRKLARREKYVLPPVRGLTPLELTEKNLSEKFKNSDKDAFHALASTVNIAPEIAEEVFFQTKISKEKPAKEITAKEAKMLAEKTKEFYTISKELFSPVKTQKNVLPFFLEFLKEKTEKINSLNDFLDEFFSRETENTLKVSADKEENTEKSKLEFMQVKQEKAKEHLQNIQTDSAAAAEKIYSNYEEIQAILQIVNDLQKQKKSKQEILDELKVALNEEWFKKITTLDVKKKEIVLEL